MKKLLITLLAATLGSMAFADGHMFPDVPAGHWAEDAVERIADLNIVIGFPDGTFRGNEAFTRYQASLVVSRLLNIVEADMATMGARLSAVESATSDIASIENDVASQGVAVDAAQSAADAAHSAADGAQNAADANAAAIGSLESDVAAQGVAIGAAQSAAEANAAEIAALNSLMQLLGDQIESAQADSNAGFAAVDASLADLEADIVNIREFAILLRRDQVAVRNRVADLEGRVDAMEALDLDARVTALENNPLGFNGTIDLSYVESAFGGVEAFFDVDRAYGVGMNVDMGASAFSTGAEDINDDDDSTDVGEVAEDRADLGTNEGPDGTTAYNSDFDASITVNLGDDLSFDGESTPRGLNSFSATATFVLEAVDIAGADTSTQYVFGLDSFSSTFEVIGADPITVDFGEEVAVSFTPYTLAASDEVGLVASLGAPDMLAFVDPALHVAYLTSDQDEAAPVDMATMAVRGTLSPIEGWTGGFSVVADVSNLSDLDTDLEYSAIVGVDGGGTIGVAGLELTLAGEYATTMDQDDATDEIDVLFLEGEATLADILGGVSIGGNYRDIDAAWTAGDADEYGYAVDQTGFGVDASLGLLMIDVTAFYDSYEVTSTESENVALGVTASADLFAGFSLSGDFTQVSVGGDVADEDDMGDYETGFGVALSHDGSADDALISNLNLGLSYDADTVDFDVTTIAASADYEATVSILTLTPYVSYELVSDADTPLNDAADLKVGTGLVTAPLETVFAPSLEAAINYRNKNFSEADYVAEQLQWSVGLNLAEFLLPNTSLAARYGSYTATNWTVDDMSAGPDNNGITNSVAGFEVQVNFYDLVFDYGLYDFDPNTDVDDNETKAQQFGVAYQVGF